ncbi:ScbR family autoregulator-binding transcription factor [Humibacter albus]|uniref:ScbR family autoregulator-binding transcription factor n=1 Tax=Humibacter albus TaxID=427754 RepID=UPI0003B711D2|nr:ScbR family autoregulator-binding transcription factor [Humibacter albus]
MTQARALARREEIVHAAASEFDEVGYAAASLSSIAGRLGRTKGALGYHFSSKSSLALEVVSLQYGQWEAIADRIRADGYSGLDAIVMLSFVVAGRFRDDVLVRAGIRLQHDAGLNDVDLPVPFVGWIALVRTLLTESAPDVPLPHGVDAESAAEVLVEAFTGLQQVAHRLTRASDIDERVDRYWLMFLPAFGVSDPRDMVRTLRRSSTTY